MSSLLTVSPGAVVCNESKLLGEVSIGARTVVHPKATIIAEAGPIIIGENNLIEEQAVIVNARNPDSQVLYRQFSYMYKFTETTTNDILIPPTLAIIMVVDLKA